MALATLSIDLVAKLASFEQDMGKAARAAEKTAAQISSAFGVIKSAAGGLVAGGRLAELRRFGHVVLVVGLLAPPLLALAGAAVGLALGLSTGGVALLATLAGSASYIAAPTAMRIAVPQANAALSITAALGVSFPFNLVIGIPLYIELARRLAP